MVDFYILRDYFHLKDTQEYVIFKQNTSHSESFHVENREINCKKCKYKKKIYCSKDFKQDWCPKCSDRILKIYSDSIMTTPLVKEAPYPEFLNQNIKDKINNDRRENTKSMIQPWREGEPSREFIEAYPKQANKMFTLKERLKARPVWDLPSNWQKTR